MKDLAVKYYAGESYYVKEVKQLVDEKLIAHLAELSMLTLTGEELTEMASDMADIIEIMDTVKEADKRISSFRLDETDFDNLRKDMAEMSFPTEQILINAKGRRGNTFTVPKVV